MYKNDRVDPPRAYLLSLLRAGVKRGGNSVERSLTTWFPFKCCFPWTSPITCHTVNYITLSFITWHTHCGMLHPHPSKKKFECKWKLFISPYCHNTFYVGYWFALHINLKETQKYIHAWMSKSKSFILSSCNQACSNIKGIIPLIKRRVWYCLCL